MCDCVDVEIGSYGNQIQVSAPEHMRGLSLGCMTIRESICLDRCIANEVQALWRDGVTTTGCCCGHNKTTGYIGVYGEESKTRMLRLGYDLLRSDDSFYPKSVK